MDLINAYIQLLTKGDDVMAQVNVVIERAELTKTTISLSKKVMQRADEIVGKRLIPGITNRSALIEYALIQVFKQVPKEA